MQILPLNHLSRTDDDSAQGRSADLYILLYPICSYPAGPNLIGADIVMSICVTSSSVVGIYMDQFNKKRVISSKWSIMLAQLLLER